MSAPRQSPTIALTIVTFLLCGCVAPPDGRDVHPAGGIEAPRADVPVAEAPVAEAPVAEAPVAEAPAGEAPAAEAPAGEAPASPETIDGVTIDRARGEIRFPCRFVNPTRLLEVFACHQSGPTHETVVEFDVTGPAIYQALRALGTRSARYFNGTSPSDFERNRGDRVLVLLRWEADGAVVELPAEGMLVDGPSGFPSFLRGFSVSTRGLLPHEEPVLPAAGPPAEAGSPGEAEEGSGGPAPPAEAGPTEPRVPVAVEISLGATNRQSPSYALLTHETNFPRLSPWTVPPQLDPDSVGDHAVLVENDVPATLIIRPIASEVELVALGRALDARRERTSHPQGPSHYRARRALHDRLEPIAREIDDLKAEYVDLLEEIRELIAAGDPAERSEAERSALAERGVGIVRRGRWLCARIEELYLKRYGLEEELKASWAEAKPDLEPELRDEIVLQARGVSFEPRLAARRVELAALDLPGSDLPPGERSLRRAAIETEMSILELEREGLLAEATLRAVRARLEALDPVEESYPRRLFEEDERHFAARIRLIDGRMRAAKTELAEIEGTLRGTWDAVKGAALAERAAAKEEIRCAELEEELAKILAEIRWEESDLESGVPERQREARSRLDALLLRKSEIESSIAECRR